MNTEMFINKSIEVHGNKYKPSGITIGSDRKVYGFKLNGEESYTSAYRLKKRIDNFLTKKGM